MPPLTTLALGDLDHELTNTRRVLERLPDEHLGWRPHPKSFTLGELATHIATLPFYGTSTLETESFDLATAPRQAGLASREAILARFDETAGALRDAVANADDAVLSAKWRMTMGAREILNLPRAAVIRGFTVSHLIHHRGQLTVYLRLLDVPLPNLYGPTADER